MAQLGTSPPRLLPGELIDGYQVGVVIGQGGMATVYEGRVLDTGAVVAIKVINVQWTADLADVQRRFFNELVSATRVHHPKIVRVSDFGVTSANVPYIVMERLHGRTVEQHLEHLGPMDPITFVPKLVEMCDALELAHAQGLVHADIKPSNVFLSQPGTAEESLILLDFGVACRPTGEQGSPMWGGTPRYAPPERLRGAAIQPQVDVFQIGMLLTEMLSGVCLVRPNTVRECLAVHAQGLQLPTALSASAFGPVLRTTLDPNPARRYASMADLREALIVALLAYQANPIPLEPAHTQAAKTMLYSHSVPASHMALSSASMPSMSYTGSSALSGPWTGPRVVRVPTTVPAAQPPQNLMIITVALAMALLVVGTFVGGILVAVLFTVMRGSV